MPIFAPTNLQPMTTSPETATMRVTVQTSPGHVAVFTIEFDKTELDEVIENVSLVGKPADLKLGEEMGFWRVVNTTLMPSKRRVK